MKIGSLRPTFELRQIDGVPVPLQGGAVYPSQELPSRPRASLAGVWRKKRLRLRTALSLTDREAQGILRALEKEAGGFHQPDFDADLWEDHRIPGPENRFPGLEEEGSPEQYEGGVLYRFEFTPSMEFSLSRCRLTFPGVNYLADVWLNGRYLGYHEGGFTPFSFVLGPGDIKPTTNVLAVRVDNPAWGERIDLVPPGPCPWFNATGILREPFLESLPDVEAQRLDLVPRQDLSGFEARMVLRSVRSREVTLEWRIRRLEIPQGREHDLSEEQVDSEERSGWISGPTRLELRAGKISTATWRLGIRGPEPWSLSSPSLYQVEARLLSGAGDLLDRIRVQSGLRRVSLGGSTGLLLNRRPIRLTGVCRFEQWPDSGPTGGPEAIRQDLSIAQRLGANFVRTGLHPNQPLTYLLTDRLGLGVLEEPPLAGFGPREFEAQERRGIALQTWREMVFRDLNRPSILCWGTAHGANGERRPVRRAQFLQTVRQEQEEVVQDDRLLIQAASSRPPSPEDPSQLLFQVAGFDVPSGGGEESIATFLAAAGRFLRGRSILITGVGRPAEPESVRGRFRRLGRGREDAPHGVDQDALQEELRAAARELDRKEMEGESRILGFAWWSLFDRFRSDGQVEVGMVRMDRRRASPLAATFRQISKWFLRR